MAEISMANFVYRLFTIWRYFMQNFMLVSPTELFCQNKGLSSSTIIDSVPYNNRGDTIINTHLLLLYFKLQLFGTNRTTCQLLNHQTPKICFQQFPYLPIRYKCRAKSKTNTYSKVSSFNSSHLILIIYSSTNIFLFIFLYIFRFSFNFNCII